MIVFISLLLFGGNVFAQEKLSLEDCINAALENNSSLKQKEFTKKSAEYDYLNSYSSYLPTVDVSLSKGETTVGPSKRQADPDEISGFDPISQQPIYGGVIEFPKSLTKSNSISASINQNIFNGERLANIFQTKSIGNSVEYDLISERNNTILSVTQSYYNLIKQQKLEEVNEVAVQRSQDQLQRTEKMFELGSKAKLDVFQAKVNLGNDKIALLNQNNIVDDAKRVLNLSMGREPIQPISVILIDEEQSTVSELDELLKIAKENQPLLKKGEADIKSSEYGVMRWKAQYLPTIGGFFQYNRSNSELEKVYSDYDLNYRWTVGLQLNLSLFNGFNDYLNIQKAKINEKSSREMYTNYLHNLQSRVKGYYENYNSYIKIIDINEENLEAAKEELRLAEERYSIGAGTSLEVREAQVKLTRAEETLIAARYNALITLAQLDNELGITEKKLNN